MKMKSLTLIIISLIALSIFMACERETILHYESFDTSLSLKFPSKLIYNNDKAEFTGEIRISTIDSVNNDTTEIKIMELNIIEVNDSTYRTVDAIEVPFGEELFISILAALGEEEYEGEATASFEPGVSTEVVIEMVEIIVHSNEPPICYVLSPSNGESFTIGTSINMYVEAFDEDGTISEVRFYQNDNLISTATTSPYEYNWDTSSEIPGSYELKAIAVDNENAETENTVSVNLTTSSNELPTCFVISPTSGESFTIGTNINIYVEAFDNDGTISEVRFYQNDNLLSTATSLPYEYNWDTSSETAGSVILKTIAVDNEFGVTENTVSITLAGGSITPTMVLVPAGSFDMGDYFGEGDAHELPIHNVSLNSYYIANAEVTQLEYETVMGVNPSNPSYGFGDNYSVNYVSYYDIMVFCNIASNNAGLNPCYTILGSTDPADWGTVPSISNVDWDAVVCDFSANGYRLPTEAEWEYAAKGGSNWADNLRYAGCLNESELTDYAWYDANSSSTSHEIGTKLPNQLGIYDMSGNLWEWCFDWYGDVYYASSPGNNPSGPSSGSSRIIRGGSWYDSAVNLRSASRGNDIQNGRYHGIGFRLVRTAQ